LVEPKIRATDFVTGKGHDVAIERLAFSPDITHKGVRAPQT